MLILLSLPLPWAAAQQVSEQAIASSRPARRWATTLQTGFADTFQLTLGGTFGWGPAWQNRLTPGAASLLAAGELLSLHGHGWSATFPPSRTNNSIAGLGCRAPV